MSTGVLTIPASHYSSQGALATAIQTAINSDSNLTSVGNSVIVSYENGSYTIKSASKGSSTSLVLDAIGTNLDGFLKMNGSADADDIGTSQTGTASTAITLNGSSSFITSTDADGLVDAESIVGAGDLTIDGNAVTEQWVGGDAPSEGGSDGYDIYTYNILKIGTGTGDSGFFVIAHVVNAT